MKYRIVTDDELGFKVQGRLYGLFWVTCTKEFAGRQGINSFESIEDAEMFIHSHVEARMKRKSSGKVVKTYTVTSEDRVLWKLQGK